MGSVNGEGLRGEDCTFTCTCIHVVLVHVHEYVQCRSCAGHVTYILSRRRDGRRLWGHSEE